MGQWIGWTVDFHGQSSLSHVTVGQDKQSDMQGSGGTVDSHGVSHQFPRTMG